MAKRFSDTEKWKKLWFRKLTPVHKCFWEYIRDSCNNAGIWEIDFELASFQIGAEINQTEIETVFKKQFIKINDSKWFLTDFIEWQYNCSLEELNPKNNAHLSAIRLLEKFKIKEVIRGLAKGSVRASSAPMDKDKNKVKNLDKDTRVEKKMPKHKYGQYKNVLLSDQELEELKTKFDNWKELIKKLDEGIEMKGYKYKSHYLAIVNVWSKNEFKGLGTTRTIIKSDEYEGL